MNGSRKMEVSKTSGSEQNETHYKRFRLIPIWVNIAITILLLSSVLDWGQGYFEFIRWVMFIFSFFAGIHPIGIYIKNDVRGILFATYIAFLGVAFLYNPLHPVHLERETWIGVNCIVATFVMLSAIWVYDE